MNGIRHWMFYLLIFSGYLGYSQFKISGKITDSQGKAISTVDVKLNPSNQSTSTNAFGEFYFENISNGKYTITTSIIGFKSEMRTVQVSNEDLILSINLTSEIENLETVIVTGTFNPRPSLETSTSTSALTQREIQKVIPRGTANLLQEIPGTFVDASAGEVYTRVYTRGVSASAEDDLGWYYVSLQEDGLPVSLVQHSYYSPDLFHRYDLTTKKVEATRGGSSSITATNAPGGIYNFISHDTQEKLFGEIELSSGFQGNSQNLYRIDGRFGSPLGNNWFINAGGHYRKDDGVRNNDFTLSKGGQFKLDILKNTDRGFIKLWGKLLNDYTNRYTGVAAVNWDSPEPAFGQDFNNTSLLMPAFKSQIPDGRRLSEINAFDPSNGVHAQDYAFGINFEHNFGNDLLLTNQFKISDKSADWQTSISNAFVSISNPLAYFISGADFPIGQVVFNDARTGKEVARIDNSGILAGQPAQYLTEGRLPNDAIMGTSAWYKNMDATEWMNQLMLQKEWKKHQITTGGFIGSSNTSHFTQGSFAYTTYEPNPSMLKITLENPNQSVIELSDENGVSNYGGLFYVNTEAQVTQLAAFANDLIEIDSRIHLDLGLRYETINHDGWKDRFAPNSLDGGVDGDTTTAYDNGILVPTGDRDNFDYNYNYLSYSAGINYKINSNIAVFSRFSKGNKAPELNYYFNNFSNVPINEKGVVQKILQTELGLKLKSKHLSLATTAFWSALKDISSTNFEFDSDTNNIFYTPILLNESRTIGLEWEGTLEMTNNFSLFTNGVVQNPKAKRWHEYNASGTVDDSDDTINDYSGNTLPFNPKLMFNFGSNLSFKRLSGFLKWQFMGKRFGNVSNGFELPSYSIFNAASSYKINDRISAHLLVNNLFNSEGLANFFGANAFGASASGSTPEFVSANPDASFVVVPVLRRSILFKLNYSF